MDNIEISKFNPQSNLDCVFYPKKITLDVGHISPEKAEEYIKKLSEEYWAKSEFDGGNGTAESNKKYLEMKIHQLIEMMGNHPDATKLIDSKLWSVLNVYNPKYEGLVDDSEKLAALEAGGVDNWEWYSESLKDYFGEEDEDEEEVEPKNENSK